MGIIRKIKCDNPGCTNEEEAEWWASRGTNHSPPYGWLKVEGFFQGTGPGLTVEVCSVACLTPAVDRAIDLQRQDAER